jgi:predicted DNA-binding transcriptional regulator AlpA
MEGSLDDRKEGLVRARDAFARCAISESTARRLIADGDFPRPIILSRTRNGRPARVAFVEAELAEWVAARIASARGTVS